MKFVSVSKVPAEKLAFVIADAKSRMGMVMKSSGIITTERVGAMDGKNRTFSGST